MPGHICFCLFVLNLFCVCVFFEFLVFIADSLVADFLLEFEVVGVSKANCFVSEPCLGVAKRWGEMLGSLWKCRSRKKKSLDGDEMR